MSTSAATATRGPMISSRRPPARASTSRRGCRNPQNLSLRLHQSPKVPDEFRRKHALLDGPSHEFEQIVFGQIERARGEPPAWPPGKSDFLLSENENPLDSHFSVLRGCNRLFDPFLSHRSSPPFQPWVARDSGGA